MTIRVKEDDKDETIRDVANGIEEGVGLNTVVVSNVTLRSDNPIECTMGRLVDMAFHHSVIGDTELGDLATPFDPDVIGPTRKEELKKKEQYIR